MGQNILGFCIVATVILMASAAVIIRKDGAVTAKENVRMFGGLAVALVAESAGYFMIS
jgi:hypothetical protein